MNIKGKAKAKSNGVVFVIHGYFTDDSGKVTHINIERNRANTTWEPIEEFTIEAEVLFDIKGGK